jgi:hypothetical protein
MGPFIRFVVDRFAKPLNLYGGHPAVAQTILGALDETCADPVPVMIGTH